MNNSEICFALALAGAFAVYYTTEADKSKDKEKAQKKAKQPCGVPGSWRLDGRTAVVTGGTAGIGFACAEQLLQLGARVLVCSRTQSSVDKSVAELGENAFGCACDVSSAEGRKLLLDAVSSQFGGQLDVLVNNVGTNRRAPIHDTTEEEYSVMMRTNIDSCFFLCKDFFPHLRASKQGSVVNVASVAGIRSSGTGSIYAASKGAMIQLTRALSCEWACHNIRVNAICPWMTYTPLLREAVKKDPSQIEVAASWTPLGRLAEPEESGNVAAFLASPAASYVTGQVIAVDGGISAQGFSGPCCNLNIDG